ncbi:MFS transporter [Leptospira sp. 96542]|nr:MFS transporter [Leptospira sp. 96542]
MNLFFYYTAFATGTLAGSSFLYSVVIFSQTLEGGRGFSGLVFLFLFLPFPLIFLYTGYLLDRFSKKWVLLVFQSLHLLASLSIFLFESEIRNLPYLLLGVAFMNGIGMTTVLPGRMAILKEITEPHRLVFHTIAGNLLLIFSFGMSPLAVGYLRESLDYTETFSVISAFHAFSIVSFLFLRPKSVHKEIWTKPETGLVLRFLGSDQVARQVLYVTVLSMLALGPIQVLLPKYIRDILGLGELARGAVLVALGPGLFLGGFLTILFHHWERKGLILLSMLILSAIFFLGFVPFSSSTFTSVFLFCFGLSGGVLTSLLPAILQKRAEDSIRGRILSLYTVCFQFTPAVSGFISAVLGDNIGIVETFYVFGMGITAAALIGFFHYSELRKF